MTARLPGLTPCFENSLAAYPYKYGGIRKISKDDNGKIEKINLRNIYIYILHIKVNTSLE